MKMSSAIAGYSETVQNKFTARQWAALIRFVVLKTGSRFKTFGRKLKRLVMKRRCAPLWSQKSRNNKLMLKDSPSGCGLAMHYV